MSELGSASKAKHDRIIMADVDFIIIGAGTAGCILANRLSENPRNSVVLIEAGKADNHPLIHIPAGFVNLMTNSSLNWMLSTCEQEILNNRIMNMPRGKVLGGTSAINGMLLCVVKHKTMMAGRRQAIKVGPLKRCSLISRNLCRPILVSFGMMRVFMES